jgi:hypothetical protein
MMGRVKRIRLPALVAITLGIALVTAGCGGGDPAGGLDLSQDEPVATLPSLAVVTPTAEPDPTAEPGAIVIPTATSTPLPTPVPVATQTPLPTETASATPTPSVTPILINRVDIAQVVSLTPETRDRVRQIFAAGQLLGRDPEAFSRLGASIVDTFHFLGRFDAGPYDLGPYAYLEPAIEQYSGSFDHVGVAARRGLTAQASFNPTWAVDEACEANETIIDCEIRLHNPSVFLVVLGTNDIYAESEFAENYRSLVAYIINQGIIPVLATKADRFEGEDNRNNFIIRQVAEDFQVPLWDFDLLAETLPGRGMGGDNVHLTLFDYYDYKRDQAYETGYGLYNLTALMMLYEIWQELSTS